MRLVAPDRVIHAIAFYDEVALKRVVERYESNRKKQVELAKNLRQLLGWTNVGDDRDGCDETANFQLLTNIWCLQHDVSRDIVAVVGKYPHVWKTVVQPHPTITFTETSMAQWFKAACDGLEADTLSLCHALARRRSKVKP